MTINQIFTEDNGVVNRLSGVITGAEIIAQNAKMHAKESFNNNLSYYLCDLSQVEQIDINADEVAKIAEQDLKAAHKTQNQIVVVVATSDLIFGLGRMWQTLVEDSPLKAGVFRSMDEANKWIGENIVKVHPKIQKQL